MEFGFLLQLGDVDLTVAYVLHVVFGTVLAGAVLYFTYGVTPLAHAGELSPGSLAALTGKLTTVTRVSAALVFVTGGHQAGVLYTLGTLTGTGRGHLVLAMLGLWFAMVALVEVGASKLREGTARDKVRSPAREARPFLRLAAAAAVIVLVDAGLLAAGVTF